MTPQEAIDVLERERNKSHWNSLDELKQASDAWKMALEALEKQIPKKVRITTSTKRCAVCGRQLSVIGNMHPTRLYCQKCGQAIDWE